jgi:hypothetical protein
MPGEARRARGNMAKLPASLAGAGIELLFENRAHPYIPGSECSAPE